MVRICESLQWNNQTIHNNLYSALPGCLATSTSPLRAKCGVDPPRQSWHRFPTRLYTLSLCCLIHTASFSAREDTITLDELHTCELVTHLLPPQRAQERLPSTILVQTEDVGMHGGSDAKGPFGRRLTNCHRSTVWNERPSHCDIEPHYQTPAQRG